jgi:hypothetical protein
MLSRVPPGHQSPLEVDQMLDQRAIAMIFERIADAVGIHRGIRLQLGKQLLAALKVGAQRHLLTVDSAVVFPGLFLDADRSRIGGFATLAGIINVADDLAFVWFRHDAPLGNLTGPRSGIPVPLARVRSEVEQIIPQRLGKSKAGSLPAARNLASAVVIVDSIDRYWASDWSFGDTRHQGGRRKKG